MKRTKWPSKFVVNYPCSKTGVNAEEPEGDELMKMPEPLLNNDERQMVENICETEKTWDENNVLMPCDLRHDLIVAKREQANKVQTCFRAEPAASTAKDEPDVQPLLPVGMN